VGVAVPADVEEGADVGVVEGGDGPRLALEASLALRVLCEGRGEDLDGDGAVEAGVSPAPDLAHPASADRRDELVGPEPRTWLKGHGIPEDSIPQDPAEEVRAGVWVLDRADAASVFARDPGALWERVFGLLDRVEARAD
jgi:hypothetical protein